MALGTSLGIDWCGCGGASGVACNDITTSGGTGITDDTIALDPAGGVITIMFNAQTLLLYFLLLGFRDIFLIYQARSER